MTDHPNWWDPFSEQPYKLSSELKSRIEPENLKEYLKVLTTACSAFTPIVFKYLTLSPDTPPDMKDLAGLSIGTDPRWREDTMQMVEEIGVRHLLVRIPVWQLEQLEHITELISQFPAYHFLVNVLQCRDSIMHPDQWKKQLLIIFDALSPICRTFQIGNAINRSKWGCQHSGQAMHLFHIADQIRGEFPHIKLLGSSVIDFEPMITLRTLYNFLTYKMDGCASLLYVNRRGSPNSRQFFFFDLRRKLKLHKAILSLSNNTKDELWITEINWPLLNTKPYTPNSGHPHSTVNEETQAIYLKQYFNIARKTGWVKRVYWWQLIHPGYGLVDSRGDKLRKRHSYYAFKSLFHEVDVE